MCTKVAVVFGQRKFGVDCRWCFFMFKRMINCRVHSIPVGSRWCFTFRRMTNCHVHSITHWFQKNKKRERKKKRGFDEGFVARQSYTGPICRLWRKQTTTTTGRSDSYDNGIKFGSPEPRDLRHGEMLCLLYPLGTRAKAHEVVHISPFVRSLLLPRCTFGARVWVQVQIGCPLRRKLQRQILFYFILF